MTDEEVNLPNSPHGTSNKMCGSTTPEQLTFSMAQWLSEFYRKTPALPDDFLADRLEKKTQVRDI
jgi:hypothetical protein